MAQNFSFVGVCVCVHVRTQSMCSCTTCYFSPIFPGSPPFRLFWTRFFNIFSCSNIESMNIRQTILNINASNKWNLKYQFILFSNFLLNANRKREWSKIRVHSRVLDRDRMLFFAVRVYIAASCVCVWVRVCDIGVMKSNELITYECIHQMKG